MLYQEAERLFVAEAKVERLEAQAAALRETLEAVEWGPQGYCLFCGNHEDDGHRADCSRQAALSGDAGSILLAETAAMREALEAAKAYLLADVATWNPLPKIEAALSGDAGRPLLERLRNAEAELENGHKALDAAGVLEADEHDALYSVAGRVAKLRQERDEAREARDFYAREAIGVGNMPKEGR